MQINFKYYHFTIIGLRHIYSVFVKTVGGPIQNSPYSIAERRVPKLTPVLGSQPAGDVSHKPGGRLPYFPPGLQLPSQPIRGLLSISLLGEQRHMGVNSLPETVTRQRCGCDLNPGPSAPESSTLNTGTSHPYSKYSKYKK